MTYTYTHKWMMAVTTTRHMHTYAGDGHDDNNTHRLVPVTKTTAYMHQHRLAKLMATTTISDIYPCRLAQMMTICTRHVGNKTHKLTMM